MPDGATSARLTGGQRGWRLAPLLAWPPVLISARLLMNPATPDLCPFHRLTHLPCPLCGGTHAVAGFAQADWAAAIDANAGVSLLILIAAAHCLLLTAEAASGLTLFSRSLMARVWKLGLAVLLMFGLVRLIMAALW